MTQTQTTYRQIRPCAHLKGSVRGAWSIYRSRQLAADAYIVCREIVYILSPTQGLSNHYPEPSLHWMPIRVSPTCRTFTASLQPLILMPLLCGCRGQPLYVWLWQQPSI